MQGLLLPLTVLWHLLATFVHCSPVSQKEYEYKGKFQDKRLKLLELQEKARSNLEDYLDYRAGDNDGEDDGSKHAKKSNGPQCTRENLRIRKEWRFMSKEDRADYVAAVYCLSDKPSLFDEKFAPGSKNLYDSIAVVHMNLTEIIHSNFNFVAWHRYYTWVYERLLRDECGYRGPFPYWEWGYDVEDPHSSPVFDGSPYSLGSDGAYLASQPNPYRQSPPPSLHLPAGTGTLFPAGIGGGCVMEGPFSNLTVHLGPVHRPSASITTDIYRYNPRCLVRDFNPYISQHYLAFNWTVWTIDDSPDILAFMGRLAGDSGQGHGNYTLNGFGLHGAGHNFLGGWNGDNSDFYSSPQEPAFFLHHSQIDRIWSIWQWLDIEERRDAAFGTITLGNVPPSRNGTLDDLLLVGPLDEAIPMRDAMSTIDGPFCYFYE